MRQFCQRYTGDKNNPSIKTITAMQKSYAPVKINGGDQEFYSTTFKEGILAQEELPPDQHSNPRLSKE